MKNVQHVSTRAIAWGLTAAVCMWIAAQAAEGSARVVAIRAGGADYTTDGTTWYQLEPGTVLKAGSTVRTDAMGVVDLNLGKNGGRVRLTPGTTLALNTLSVEQGAGESIANTEMGLSTGRIQGVLRKLSASSRFEVRTPVGSAGIRGTKYDISANGRVTVIEGLVQVYYTPPGATAPVKFDVPAGYTFDPTENSGRGGVIPTPFNVQDQIDADLNDLMRVVTEGETAEVYLPTPTWVIPNRPFDATPGHGDAKPFNVPPLYEPTTAVVPSPPVP